MRSFWRQRVPSSGVLMGFKEVHFPSPLLMYHKGRYDTILGRSRGRRKCDFGNYFACLFPPDFHFSRQILFSLLAQEFGRALAKFRIVRQSIERIPPQKIRFDRVFLEAG